LKNINAFPSAEYTYFMSFFMK